MAVDLTGPEWMTCIGDHVVSYQEQVEDLNDEDLVEESRRIEVLQPPTKPEFNDRDWRLFRRMVRQELHARGIEGHEPKT